MVPRQLPHVGTRIEQSDDAVVAQTQRNIY
jgi:hypothetical protein